LLQALAARKTTSRSCATVRSNLDLASLKQSNLCLSKPVNSKHQLTSSGGHQEMSKTSWVELCVSDFGQSIQWFENVLGFRVVARDANEYAELNRGETSIQLAADDAPYWETARSRPL